MGYLRILLVALANSIFYLVKGEDSWRSLKNSGVFYLRKQHCLFMSHYILRNRKSCFQNSGPMVGNWALAGGLVSLGTLVIWPLSATVQFWWRTLSLQREARAPPRLTFSSATLTE